MTWVRTDDGSPNHPKFARAGVEAFGWWVAAKCYCNRLLTDGLIPTKDLPHVFPGVQGEQLERIIRALVKQSSAIKTRSGLRLHDYLEYQPSREQVMKIRQAKAESGRLGGLRSGETRSLAKHLASEESKQTGSTLLHHGRSKREAPREAPSHPIPSHPNIDPIPSQEAGPVAHATNGIEHRARQANALALLRSAGLHPPAELEL